MARSRFRSGDHVVSNRNGKHGDVKNVVDNMGTGMPVVEWKSGGTETVFDSEISGTGQCKGRNGCSQG